MNKFTPGPWVWVEEPELIGSEMPKIVGANGELVCDFGSCEQYYPTEGDPPSGADKYLMVAAPELLEALEDAIQYLEPLLPDEALVPHRAVIAKAKGES